jgi:ferritin-like metal-binding protein YciE
MDPSWNSRMPLKNLADLFYEELRDIYGAEKQLVQLLPKLREIASNEALRRVLQTHCAQTKAQVTRVEEAFQDTGRAAREKACEAIKGFLEEAVAIIQHDAEPAVRDAAIIACAQKVEHYEIAAYGSLCTWAEMLGYKRALCALKENLDEEDNADQVLTGVAEAINIPAGA